MAKLSEAIEDKSNIRIEFVIHTKFRHDLDAQMNVDSHTDEDDERCFVNILEAIRIPIYDFIHGGASVTVTHHNQGEVRTERDLTGSFFLTAEQWSQVSVPKDPRSMPLITQAGAPEYRLRL